MLEINVSVPLQSLLQTIILKYLANSYCLTLVSENIQLKPLSNSLVYFNPGTSTGKPFLQMLLNASEMGCSDYIVDVINLESFLSDLEEVTHAGIVRRSDRKLIIILPDDQYYLQNILKEKAVHFIADVLLIVPDTTDKGKCQKYNLLTHKFVGTADVDSPLYLDQWDECTQQFKENANLFPHDISDMQGRPLKVACFDYKPYVLLDLDENLEPRTYDGMEMRVVIEFCRWVNCTIEIIRDDEGQWGQIFDNRTGDGVLGAVADDRADVGITALYSWYHEWTFLDFSAPYIRSGITCVAPGARALPSWELPVLPFDVWVWAALLSTLLYASIVLSIIRGGSISRSVFTTFGMMITQTQPEVGRNWKVRGVTGWLLITGLVIDNAYGGGLASTFTVPKFEKSIDTIQDLVDSKIEWGATHDAWVFSMTLSPDPKIMHLVNQFRVYDSDTLRRKSFTRNMGFSIEKLPAGAFAIGEYLTEEALSGLELMLEEFYWEQCVLTARKNSPYTAKVTDFVGHLHESGLILAWETEVALKYLNNDVQLTVRLSRSRREVKTAPLDFHHIVGIFFLWVIGVTASIIVLFGELFVYHLKNKETYPGKVNRLP